MQGWAGDRNTTEPIDVVLFSNLALQPGAITATPGVNWHGCDTSGIDLTGSNLTGANLSYAVTSGATIASVVWKNTTCPDGTNSDVGGTCVGHGF